MLNNNAFQVPCGLLIEKCACGAEIVRVPDGKEIVVVTYQRGLPFNSLHERHACEYSDEETRRAVTDGNTCRGCGVPIHWEVTSTGKRTPVDFDGNPHWHSCPNADEFRREKRASTRAENAGAQADAPALWNGENESPSQQMATRKAAAERLDLSVSWCCQAPIDESRVISAKGRHNGHGPRYCSRCKQLLFRV